MAVETCRGVLAECKAYGVNLGCVWMSRSLAVCGRPIWIKICLCACVRVREEEREREKGTELQDKFQGS